MNSQRECESTVTIGERSSQRRGDRVRPQIRIEGRKGESVGPVNDQTHALSPLSLVYRARVILWVSRRAGFVRPVLTWTLGSHVRQVSLVQAHWRV